MTTLFLTPFSGKGRVWPQATKNWAEPGLLTHALLANTGNTFIPRHSIIIIGWRGIKVARWCQELRLTPQLFFTDTVLDSALHENLGGK